MYPPTLLSLPREIRDIIYTHLSHTIRYAWPRNPDYSSRDLDIMELILDNAPITNVLLVSAQIHNEYQDALDARRLAGTVVTRPIPKHLAFLPRIWPNERVESALARLRDVSFLAADVESDIVPVLTFWEAVAGFAEVLVAKVPRLETLQVAKRIMSPRPMPHRNLSNPNCWPTYDAATHPMFRLPVPPAHLTSELLLVRYGEGYHLGYAKIGPNKLEPGTASEQVEHCVARVGIYAFARIGKSVELMDRSVLVEQWSMPRYPWAVLNGLGEEWECVRRWPDEVKEWKERKVSEVGV
jgi:hypothetical protein